jgi:exopolysaccharide biosynthesis polyprenyl glycosylphosphotransferase
MQQEEQDDAQGARWVLGSGVRGAVAMSHLAPTDTDHPAHSASIAFGTCGQDGVDDDSLHRTARRTAQIRLSKFAITIGDLAAIVVALVVATYLKARYNPLDPVPWQQYLVTGVLTLPLWLAALRWRRLYETRFIGRRIDELRRVADACVLAVLGIIVVDFFFKLDHGRTWVVWVGLASMVSIGIHREIVRRTFQARHRQGVGLRRVVIVGDNDEALAIEAMLCADRSLGYKVVGRVVQRSGTHTSDVGGMLVDDTIRAVRDANAQGVVIAVTALDAGVSNHLVRALAYSGLHLELSSALSDISASRLSMRPMGRFPVVYIEPVQRFGWRPVAKRAFDIVGSAALLVVTVPLLALVAVAVKVTSPGPVLFSQERVGRGGSTFRIYKFRTMVPDAEARLIDLRTRNEADGPLFKLKDDPRVTSIGRLLRQSSIDELPQLWNVLRGEMSLVGPRPALPAEAAEWSPELFHRLRVRPGISGMWQVNGRSEASFDEYTRLDLYYVDNWSLFIDMAILAKTIPAVIAKRGAA